MEPEITFDIIQNLSLLELVVFIGATARLTLMLLYDSFPFEELRIWWLRRFPSSETEFVGDQVDRTDGVFHVTGNPNVPLITPDGEVFYALKPGKLGELFECPWCMSMWAGLAVLAVWLALPWAAWPLMVIATASLVTGLLGRFRAPSPIGQK